MAVEVRNGTGFQRNREGYVDAIAMSLWPSRGLDLIGFEVKASRSDWLSELKKPHKADEFVRFCDRWYVVIGDKDIVKPGELPSTWGLIVPRGRKLTIEVEAPQLQPQAIDRLFLASLFRAVATHAPAEKAIRVRIEAALNDERARVEATETSLHKSAQQKIEELTKAIREFEAASGVSIALWNATKIGEAVAVVMRGGLSSLQSQLRSLAEQAGHIQRIALSACETRGEQPTHERPRRSAS